MMNNEERQPMSLQRKWGLLIVMALVFGLIAGGVMYGVNLLGNSIYSGNSSAASIPQTSTIQINGSDESTAVTEPLI